MGGLIWLMAGLTGIPGLMWIFWIAAGKNAYLSQVEANPEGLFGF